MYFARFSIKCEILSGTVEEEKLTSSKIITEEGTVLDNSALNVMIEEADMRIIPHVYWSLSSSSDVLVLSNDTDVLCLLLYYTYKLFNHRLNELWICIGSGRSRRYIPVHTLARQLGETMCNVVLKAHLELVVII